MPLPTRPLPVSLIIVNLSIHFYVIDDCLFKFFKMKFFPSSDLVRKLYILITGFVISLMFLVITFLNEKYSDLLEHQAWGILISFIFSASLFNVIFSAITILFEKSLLVKSLILGDNFLEGIWIGFVESVDDSNQKEISYIIERFTQELNTIHITGCSYKLENNEFVKHTTWISTNAKLVEKENRLEYTYTCWTNEPKDKGKQFSGFANFNYERVGKGKHFSLSKTFSIWGILNDFNPDNKILSGKEIKIASHLRQEMDLYIKDAYKYEQDFKAEMKK